MKYSYGRKWRKKYWDLVEETAPLRSKQFDFEMASKKVARDIPAMYAEMMERMKESIGAEILQLRKENEELQKEVRSLEALVREYEQ